MGVDGFKMPIARSTVRAMRRAANRILRAP